jgi:DNA-binding transcriptional regulator YiaG
MNILGKEIRKYRKSLGLTQTKFGRIYDVGVTTVSRWEHGDSRPDTRLVEKILVRIKYGK